MKTKLRVVIYCMLTYCGAAAAAPLHIHEAEPPSNPKIDMRGYLAVAKLAAYDRETHRVSEDDFLHLSADPATIVLDARSKAKYDLLHVKGAINLNFADITVAELARLLPNKNARILIYCNNNFVNNERAFPTKMPTASLNLSTYIALYTYGYRNVYELAPLLDAGTTKLNLVASANR
jgi:phage shock protein E